MENPVGTGHQVGQAGGIEDVAPDRGRPPRIDLLCGLGRPGKCPHLVAGLNRVIEHGDADNTRTTGDRDLHVRAPVGSERTVCQKAVK